jgi:putative aldouronate transport system substrate-binding protein
MENTYEANLTKEVIPSNWIALDDIDRYSDISTALTDYFNQQQALFVTGELDVNDDAQWKAYTDGLNALGLEDWVKMRGIEGIAE